MAELVQLKQISGLVGQSTLSFATPQALAAADMSGVPDMTMVYVGTVDDQYIYRSSLSSPPTSDGLNVITPALPAGGRALRQCKAREPCPPRHASSHAGTTRSRTETAESNGGFRRDTPNAFKMM